MGPRGECKTAWPLFVYVSLYMYILSYKPALLSFYIQGAFPYYYFEGDVVRRQYLNDHNLYGFLESSAAAVRPSTLEPTASTATSTAVAAPPPVVAPAVAITARLAPIALPPVEIPRPPQRGQFARGATGRQKFHQERDRWYFGRTGQHLTGTDVEKREKFANLTRNFRVRTDRQ